MLVVAIQFVVEDTADELKKNKSLIGNSKCEINVKGALKFHKQKHKQKIEDFYLNRKMICSRQCVK